MISIIEQSTQERKQEIIDIFNQIKPLLDNGHSYSSALRAVDPSLARSKLSKEVINYGETQGYSRNNYSRRTQYIAQSRRYRPNKNKYGLLNVSLTKKSSYLTGHIWQYKYYENGELVKTLSRSDLRELRRIVEEHNLEWKVVDLEKAKNAYELNKIFLENARPSRNKNFSGVYRVHKANCPRCQQGFTWAYCNSSNGKTVYISSVDLNALKKKVLEASEEWIIVDEEKAKANGLMINGE